MASPAGPMGDPSLDMLFDRSPLSADLGRDLVLESLERADGEQGDDADEDDVFDHVRAEGVFLQAFEQALHDSYSLVLGERLQGNGNKMRLRTRLKFRTKAAPSKMNEAMLPRATTPTRITYSVIATPAVSRRARPK